MKFIFSILLSFFIIGCKSDNEDKSDKNIKEENFVVPEVDTTSYLLSKKISIDSNLIKKNEVSFLSLFNKTTADSIIAICNCEKNIKNNTIFIQLRTAIPTKKEIQSGAKKNNSILQTLSLGYNDSLSGQFKFLTIKLKDSLVQTIELYSKSTDKDYDGKDFETLEINNYDVRISTFNYSIASNVYGNFEMVLPKDFGYLKNDTLIKGYFKCNNWKISTKEELENWDIQGWHNKKNASKGFRIEE